MSETSRIEIHGYADGASEYGPWSWLITCEDFEDDGDITDINYFTFWREDLTKRLAKSLLEAHAPKCTYPGGEPTCLWDEGEVCTIRMSGKDGCKWWTICECDDCRLARTIMEHE